MSRLNPFNNQNSRILKYRPSNADMHEVVSGTIVALGTRTVSMILVFLVNLVIARLLGAKDAGIYYLAISTVSIAAVFGTLGLDNVIVRFIATAAEAGEWFNVREIYKRSTALIWFSSIGATVVSLLSSSWIANELYNEPTLLLPLRIACLSIVPFSLLVIPTASLRGLKRIYCSSLVKTIVVPLISLPLLLIFATKLSVSGASAVFVISTLIAYGYGTHLWNRSLPEAKLEPKSTISQRALLDVSLPLLGIALVQIASVQINTILLGAWLDSEAVGLYNVAIRVASLNALVLSGINSIMGPKIAVLHSNNEFPQLRNLLQRSVLFATVMTLPISLPFWFAPSWIMNLFGADYVSGAPVLVILAIGQAVNSATGPVGTLLIMSGYEKRQRNNIAISTAVGIVSGWILIPQLGVLGAAISTSISLICQNVYAAFWAYQYISSKII